MSKNNKKTMNERTHNSYELYKNNENSNSNNPNVNLSEEFAAEFDSKPKSRDNNNFKTRESNNNK